jgi:hypothetical protein
MQRVNCGLAPIFIVMGYEAEEITALRFCFLAS